MDYNKLIKTWPKDGARYADDELLQAWIARDFGEKYCMRPEAIFNWANKHKVVLINIGHTLTSTKLMSAVLNDAPL